MKKYKKVCIDCGSENIHFEGPIEWDKNEQIYKIQDLFDYVYCNECEMDTDVRDVEIIELNTNTKVL